ncbi:VOC family protein [Kribbella sp. NPDC056861]|uniref:VOC family protein n=1 Tax=Kribbella sp. NPDC056861 TaxID=3154857 RepID=UPI00343793B4
MTTKGKASMITVTAEQRVQPGKEAKLDALMAGLMDNIAQHEPGCTRFDYVVDGTDPTRRLCIETYRDEVAFAQHGASQYLADFIPELLDCLVEPPTVVKFGDRFAPTVEPSFFHTGIVVPDLDKAIAYYADTFDLRFTEPGVFSIPRLEDPDPHPFELTAVLSRTEPPYLELIQANGDGIVSADKCGQILYHAYWEPDMDARLDWLRTSGPGVDAVFRMEEGSTPFSMITSPDPFGNRIEYVGTDAVDPLTEWARTGVLPGGVGA